MRSYANKCWQFDDVILTSQWVAFVQSAWHCLVQLHATYCFICCTTILPLFTQKLFIDRQDILIVWPLGSLSLIRRSQVRFSVLSWDFSLVGNYSTVFRYELGFSVSFAHFLLRIVFGGWPWILLTKVRRGA